MASLLSGVEALTGSKNIGFYMIHLDKATERKPLVEKLEENLKTKLNIFSGVDGQELINLGYPTRSFDNPSANRGRGDLGCFASHARVHKHAIEKGYDYVVVFEDDCEMVNSIDNLCNQLIEFKNSNIAYDMFLLDCNQLRVDQTRNPTFNRIYDFYETHAYIASSKTSKSFVDIYEKFYSENLTYTVDGTFSHMLKTNVLTAYSFSVPHVFFRQLPGMYSYIVERAR